MLIGDNHHTYMTLRHQISSLAIIITLILIPHWLKLPQAPAPHTATYTLGFVITWVMLGASVLCLALNYRCIPRVFRHRWRVRWLVSLLLLAGWTTLSQVWAFGAVDYPGMAQNAALQLWIVTLFALAITVSAPPPRWIIITLAALLLVHGIIALIQVSIQGSLGWGMLGELRLDVAQSGISVLLVAGDRWLRPYGFLPHPNVLGGFFSVATLAVAGWVLAPDARGTTRYVLVLCLCVGFYALLLTFSRGAWLGFAVGGLVALPYVWRQWRRLLPALVALVIVGGVFVGQYYPLLLTRAGVGQANTEMRSIADRVVYTRIAQIAIAERPLTGHGANNYPWYAANYLFYNTDYDLRGDNVHNIYLGIWSDLGVIGVGLFMAMLTCGLLAALHTPSIERVACVAGVIGWMFTGLFDHYMWTLPQMQALWLLLLAVAIAPPQSESSLGGNTGIR
jgi:O-antigen ligase